MKICVITSFSAAVEPRAPRHAIAAKRAFPEAEVIFIDMAAASQEHRADPPSLRHFEIKRRTLEFPTRTSDPIRLAARRIRTRLNRFGFAATGAVTESLFGERVSGLTNALKDIDADAYIAHGVDTLLPAVQAAGERAPVVFDCMEYYSDMGDNQTSLEALATQRVESKWLPACALVIASSDCLADALAQKYHMRRPLPSYNVPPIAAALPAKRGGGLSLYWRNNVIGFGQRGLEDALQAMSRLPTDVRLFLQGRPQADGGCQLSKRIEELGLVERVTVLPPYAPEDAVRQAALYDVGLCLERKGPRNHDLTVSNKMFDYHMAGLAVISSDLPSLSQVIGRSKGGVLYEAGNPRSLAEAVLRFHSSPDLLAQLQANARRFALEEANLETELDRLVEALRAALRVDTPETSMVSSSL